MNEENKSTVIRLLIGSLICLAVGAAMLFGVLALNSYWTQTEPAERLRILCDAFTVPGVILILSTALVFSYNAGTFNGLFYGLRTAKDILLPFLRQDYVKYRDYLEKRKSKKVHGYSFIFFTGLAYMTVAIILLIRYKTLYP